MKIKIFKKLGGLGSIVKIDETMLNYKCKSHRGRSSLNRTGALITVKIYHKTTKIYVQTIENKIEETKIPIILKMLFQVVLFILTNIKHINF